MIVALEKGPLEEALQTCGKAISVKSPLPVLSHILLEANGDTVRLTGTDLDLGIAITIPAIVTQDGARALPCRLLLDIVSKLPAAQVEISLNEESGKVRIKCGRTKFEVSSIDACEYPSLPTGGSAPELEFPQRAFKAMVRKVGTAVAATDESRAVMTGIWTQSKDGFLRMVATDGRRLGLAEYEVQGERLAQALGGGTEGQTVIVPGRAMQELARIAADSEEPLRLRLTDNMLFCTLRNVSMHCRLLEGHFPDYQRVLPSTFSRSMRVGREALLVGVRRMLIVAQERQSPNLIVLDCADERVFLSANTPDLGLGQEEVPIIYEGAPLRIAFNGKYMQDVLSVLDAEEVQVDLQDDTRSAVLRALGDEGFRYLLMPVRLREAVPEEAVAAGV